MNEGRTVFAQLMDELPQCQFDKCVRRYCGNHRVRSLPTYEQFLVTRPFSCQMKGGSLTFAAVDKMNRDKQPVRWLALVGVVTACVGAGLVIGNGKAIA